MRTHALRLQAGEDPKSALDALAKEHRWPAACVLTAGGSLTQAVIRLAGQSEVTRLRGHFEVISLTGTLGPDGSHLLLAVSDGTGVTLGGHLKEGSRVYTTLEIVVAVLDEGRFSRKLDCQTGYPELLIEPR